MQEQSVILPVLRQELRLHEGPADGSGQSAWLIYDPVRHRYFQCDKESYELLGVWGAMETDVFVAHASGALRRSVTKEEVEALVRFLHTNNLTEEPPNGDALAYAEQILKSKKSILARAVHGYLFFKIPILRPQRFLSVTSDLVAPLYTRSAFWIVTIFTVLGIYLASRQWESFVATFLDFFSVEGAIYYGASLVFIKLLHEFGHAYTATRYGVRVNTMGIAFMLMLPILFTDVTDAWKLRSRRQKLSIAASGMVVELAIAGIATFLWAFLPDGPARSVAFILATTSWILSLAINLNPFMRFDGYYLLSDSWGIANLQTRAFAMTKWRLREALFGLQAEPPEDFPKATRRWLVAYGIGTWIYRLVLFLGIALLVYHMFFKALGVILFVIEILFFIALPIWNEFKEWWKMREQIVQTKRSWITIAVVAVLIAACAVPWSGGVRVPAVVLANSEFQIFPPRPSRVVSLTLNEGETVKAGARVAVLEAPDLAQQIRTTELSIELAQARLHRIAGDEKDLSQRIVLQTNLTKEREKLAGLKLEQTQLALRSPISGQVREALVGLAPGDWVNRTTPIARIVGSGELKVHGYIHEDDVWRVKIGDRAKFIPEDPLLAARSGVVTDIARMGSQLLEIADLASVYGGAIASDADPNGEIRPRSGRYMIRIALTGPAVGRVARGTVLLEGSPESFAAAAWRRVLQVVVRESGI